VCVLFFCLFVCLGCPSFIVHWNICSELLNSYPFVSKDTKNSYSHANVASEQSNAHSSASSASWAQVSGISVAYSTAKSKRFCCQFLLLFSTLTIRPIGNGQVTTVCDTHSSRCLPRRLGWRRNLATWGNYSPCR
jgi:hypothetical protein